jgi:subtilisin family serine protease
MRGLGAGLSILAVVAFPGAVAATHASAPLPAEPGELLVRFERGAAQSPALAKLDARVVERLPLPGLVRVQLEPGTSLAAAEAAFAQRPEVRYAVPNYRYRLLATPNDPDFGQLWGLHQTNDADIDAPEAWDTTTGSDAVTVAVVDTGVTSSHPDLMPNMVAGWDFFDGDADPSDTDGHGTHVAGTIGARGNDGVGITGVNWRVKLMPLRVGDGGPGGIPVSAVVQAFQYACSHGADVVNGSFGGPVSAPPIREAIAACPGTLFVFAAGNAASDNDSAPMYPCNEPGKNVICVAASDAFDTLAWFSNHGSNVHIAAPGEGILSTINVAPWYDVYDGTSMATPHVAGAAALVLAHRPTLTADALRRALTLSADVKAVLFGYVASGRLNVARALTQDVTGPTDPSVGSPNPVATWMNTNTVSVYWGGASDSSGIGGYSYGWSPDPEFEPDDTKDVDASVTTAGTTLPDGQHWFHVRAGDTFGNFGATKHIGPFLIDTFPPVRPTLSSPTHRAGVPSTNRAIEVNWTSSSDSISGLDGFSFAWGRQQLVAVDQTKDVDEAVFRTTSPRLDNGGWWFGIRARDNAGNWSDTVVLGPFVITGVTPFCNVPRLRGLTLVGAKRQLVKRGCALGRVTRAYSRRVGRGRVIAQKRAPGLRLARGAKIAVVLSRGRRARR